VLNFNGRELLDVLLPSLLAQTHPSIEIIVVDNGSSDDSPAHVAANWPSVQVQALERNIGISAGFNVCVQASSGEFVLLLNTDVELEESCVEELVRALDRDPHAVVAAAKLRDFHRRELLDGAGDIYSWTGLANRRGQGEVDRGQYDAKTDVFGACAAVALYRRSAFASVGEFDERFYALCEDVDWAMRAQLAGHGCRYVPSAVAYHMGGATLGHGLTDFTCYHLWRNGVWVIAKNLPASALARHGHQLLGGQLWHLGTALIHRRVGVWARAWRDVLLGLPGVLRERRAVQRSRRVSLSELERIIS
jgi:GT2 family glycosyltransferase